METSYKILNLKHADPRFKAYEALIYGTFLRSLRYNNDIFRESEPVSYYKAYKLFITSLLQRTNATIRLAVLTEDTDVVLGWSLYEGDHLEFVFVKRDLRKQGIGSSLVPVEIKTFGHLTKAGHAIWKSKHKNLVFNPFKRSLGE